MQQQKSARQQQQQSQVLPQQRQDQQKAVSGSDRAKKSQNHRFFDVAPKTISPSQVCTVEICSKSRQQLCNNLESCTRMHVIMEYSTTVVCFVALSAGETIMYVMLLLLLDTNHSNQLSCAVLVVQLLLFTQKCHIFWGD